MADRELPPSSAFAADDGTCDPGLASALERYGRGGGSLAAVVAALVGTRVLVPVLAERDASGVVGTGSREHALDKRSSAGIVALRAPDGRTALPVFSSVASMAAWRLDARPVPSDVARAALAALTEQWELVVLDPGGPTTALIPRPAVSALARRLAWEPAVVAAPDGDTVDARVSAAIQRSIVDVVEVLASHVVPGRRAEIAVVLELVPGLDRARLDAVLVRVNTALAADETIAERVDSLELRLHAGA